MQLGLRSAYCNRHIQGLIIDWQLVYTYNPGTRVERLDS